MQDIRYHPLVDRDSEGKDKVPMFFSGDEATVRKSHDLYLEEIVPHYYRLCAVNGLSAKAAKAYTIHCPVCGKAMVPVTEPVNNNRLGLYKCPDCHSKESEEKDYE